MKRSCALVALFTTLLLAVGCSSSTDTAVSPAASPSPSTSFNCDDPDATVEEWDQHCTLDAIESADPPTPIEFGQTAEYNREYVDSDGTTWSVKLTKVDCGLKKIAKVDSNPEWDGGDDHPEYIAAKAPSGSDFCILYWDWENIGKTPDNTNSAGDLMFGDRQWAKSSDDESRSEKFMETNMGLGYDQVNPGKKTKSADIYTVDEGTAPDAVWFPMQNGGDDNYMLFATR